MDPLKKDKIQRFLADEGMANTIFEELREFFLENHGEKDIYLLGARSMSVDLLAKARNRLIQLGAVEEKPKAQSNVGL